MCVTSVYMLTISCHKCIHVNCHMYICYVICNNRILCCVVFTVFVTSHIYPLVFVNCHHCFFCSLSSVTTILYAHSRHSLSLSTVFLSFIVNCHNYPVCAFTLFIITVDCFSFFVVNCHDYLVCAFTLFIIIVDCFSLFVVNCHNYSLYLLTLFTDTTVYMSHFNCHISYVSCSTVPSIYTFCLLRYMMYAVKC